MKYRFLGDTGVQVSALCMGTMTFGREADKQTAAAIFKRCRDAGVNFFDCADVYNKGVSEEMLGEFMSGCRDELIITTKVFGQTGPGINDRGLSRRHIMTAAEASLKRLQTDHIDLYFLHHPDKDTPLEESLQALGDLVRQGKVLYTGVSNFAAWQVMKAQGICQKQGWSRIQCIQPMYNLVKRQAEVELLPMAHSEKIGVVCYNPIGAGLLSGKYTDDQVSGTGRLQEDKMYKSRYREPLMHETAKQFCKFAGSNGFHPVSLAVAWVAHHPAVTAPIIGARNAEQLEDSLNAMEISLTPELYGQISELSPKPAPADDRTEDPDSRKKK
jgi:aryl-alcohol dehydrogenase-like predicted oxidoreductase